MTQINADDVILSKHALFHGNGMGREDEYNHYHFKILSAVICVICG